MINFIKNLKSFLESLTEPSLKKFVKLIFMVVFVCVFFGILLFLVSVIWFYINLCILKFLDYIAVFTHKYI